MTDVKVPTYRGECLNGNKLIFLVESTYCLSDIARFLLDDITYKKQTEWSGVFASRIISPICNLSIFVHEYRVERLGKLLCSVDTDKNVLELV